MDHVSSSGTFFLVVPQGFENLAFFELSRVLKTLKEDVAKPTFFPGGLEFSLPLSLGYELNHHLKIPVRILQRLHSYEALDKESFTEGVKVIDWKAFGNISSVSITARSSKLHVEKQLQRWFFSAVKLKKSGADVYVRLFRDQCTISIDTSGDPLFKRGRNKKVLEAPLRDNIAAGLVQMACQGLQDLSGWTLVDPFCGSGTFALEGCELSSEPKRAYAYQAWWKGPQQEVKLWPKLSAAHLQDKDKKATAVALDNCKSYGLKEFQVETQDLFSTDSKNLGKTLVISNLPYGKRLELDGGVDFFSGALAKTVSVWSPERVLWLVPAPAPVMTPQGYDSPKILIFKNNGFAVKALLFVKT